MNFLPLGYPPLEAKGMSKTLNFSTLYQIVKLLLAIICFFFASCGSDDAPPPSTIQPYDFHHGIKPNNDEIRNLACMDGAVGQAKNFFNKLEEKFIRQKVKRVSAREELASAMSYHNNGIKQEFNIIKDRRNRNLQKIFKRMVAVVHDELPSATHQHPDYQIFLIEPKDGSEYLNAFTIGSGMVYVSSFFYDFCEDDAELAFIIGHELGHLILGHTTDNTRRFKIVETAIGDYVGDDWTATISKAWDTISEPFNSFDEQITDFSGLYIMTAAGYDPEASQRLDYRYQQDYPSDSSVFRYGSSHPHQQIRNSCNMTYIYDAKMRFQNTMSYNENE